MAPPPICRRWSTGSVDVPMSSCAGCSDVDEGSPGPLARRDASSASLALVASPFLSCDFSIALCLADRRSGPALLTSTSSGTTSKVVSRGLNLVCRGRERLPFRHWRSGHQRERTDVLLHQGPGVQVKYLCKSASRRPTAIGKRCNFSNDSMEQPDHDL